MDRFLFRKVITGAILKFFGLSAPLPLNGNYQSGSANITFQMTNGLEKAIFP
jgi:hypothetical protein